MSGRAEASGRPARLLLADSDPSLRTVLQLALQAHGYQVALADSADTALELAGHEHPDLIVLDVGLPGVADVIRALRQASTTPILLLTWPTEPDPQAALDIGADDALTKPFGIGQLLQRLQTLRTPAPWPPGQDNKQAMAADATWMRGSPGRSTVPTSSLSPAHAAERHGSPTRCG